MVKRQPPALTIAHAVRGEVIFNATYTTAPCVSYLWIMNTFIRHASDRNKTDRQTDRIYTNVKTLVKTGYICRKFVIDCLYSRELVTKN